MAAIAVNRHESRHRTLVRGLVCLAALGFAGTAMAGDPVAGAVLGAGAGAIIGHSVGGREAAVVGGIIGAVTGAAISSSHGPRVAVQYGGGYGYAPPPVRYAPPPVVYAPPPVYYPAPAWGPVYGAPPPVVIFLPDRGHGYWRHHADPRGRPLRTWVPVAAPHGRYRPAPRWQEQRGRW